MDHQLSSARVSYEVDARLSALRREEHRDPCEIEAHLVPDSTRNPVSCFIENISASGAQIRVYDGLRVPRHCSVLIPLSRDENETRDCEVLWAADDIVGVKFVG